MKKYTVKEIEEALRKQLCFDNQEMGDGYKLKDSDYKYLGVFKLAVDRLERLSNKNIIRIS